MVHGSAERLHSQITFDLMLLVSACTCCSGNHTFQRTINESSLIVAAAGTLAMLVFSGHGTPGNVACTTCGIVGYGIACSHQASIRQCIDLMLCLKFHNTNTAIGHTHVPKQLW